MPKVLCLIAMFIAILILILFLSDLILGFVDSTFAPFRMASMTMDIVFSVCSAALAYLSWITFKEQV